MQVHGFGPLDATHPNIWGQLDPPPEYLTTGAEARKWRGIGEHKRQEKEEEARGRVPLKAQGRRYKKEGGKACPGFGPGYCSPQADGCCNFYRGRGVEE